MGVSVDPGSSRGSWDPTAGFVKERKRRRKEEDTGSSSQSSSSADDLASEIAKKRKEEEDKREAKRKEAEKLARIKTGGGYSNIFERMGDMFEANSPQDKAKREAAGEPKLYQDQKGRAKEIAERAKTFSFAADERKDRKDYYARRGVDIEKAPEEFKRLNDNLKKTDEKGRVKISLNKDKTYSDVKAEEQKRKAHDTVESDYLNYVDSQKKQGTLKQIRRNFERGLTEQIVKAPGSVKTLLAGAADVVAPEGSRIDKKAQELYKSGKKSLKEADQNIIDQGMGVNPNDNRIMGNLAAGAGSLASSLLMGLATGGSSTTAQGASLLTKAKSFLNPGLPGAVFGVNAGAEQYIGALDAGKSDFQSFSTALVGGAAEGYLEKLGVDKYLGASGGVMKKFLTRSLTEGIQEASQSLAQSGVKSTYTSVDFSDALLQALEEGGYGAVVGGGGSVAIDLTQNMIDRGVPPDVAEETAQRVEAVVNNVAAEELPQEPEVQPEEPVIPSVIDVKPPETGPTGIPGADITEPTDIQQPVEEQPVVEQPTEVAVEEPMPTAEAPKASPFGVLDEFAQNKYGKPAEKLSPKQINEGVSETKVNIKAGTEIAQKMGNAKRGINIDDTRPPLVYGGKHNKIYTDSYVAITDPVVADRINDEVAETQVKKIIKDTMKQNPELTFAEAEAGARATVAGLQEQYKDNYPKMREEADKFRIGEPNGNKAEVKGYMPSDGGTVAVISDGTTHTIVNPDKLAFINKHFPDATFTVAQDELAPIQVVVKNKVVGVIMPLKQGRDTVIPPELVGDKKPTQKEQVVKTVEGGKKSIKEVAEETGIKEPTVRRILGVGAKEGTFKRVDKGVYVLNVNGKDLAFVETGDAVESLARLAEEGFKADMVFLDIPYKTAAVTGGNRGVNYNLISVEEFKSVVNSLKKIVKDDNTPVFYMYSQATSGLKDMEKYNSVYADAFMPVARGEYTKTQKDGVTQVRNMRGDVIKPEGLIVGSRSGKLDFEAPSLNFKLVRPRGYQTEKPAEMLNALISMSTKEGDVVLDPFAGSGVTGAEAIKLNRVSYNIEKNPTVVKETTIPRIEGAFVKGDKVVFKKIKGGKVVGVKDKVWTVESVMQTKDGSKIRLSGEKEDVLWTTPESIEKHKPKGKPKKLQPGADSNIAPKTDGPKRTRSDFYEKNSKTVEETLDLIDQINKAAQANEIPRFGGLRSKTSAGQFQYGGKLKGRERIKIRDDILKDPDHYMSTLAHELSHAIEFIVVGDTKHTMEVFGDLTTEEKETIGKELVALTKELKGLDEYNSNPSYYNKPTELLARYMEVLLLDVDTIQKLAPTATYKLEQAMLDSPELSDLINAIKGNYETYHRRWTWFNDLRQMFAKHLGPKVGRKAYDKEMERRFELQRFHDEVKRLMKQKFKGVKDDQKDLFRAAEAISSQEADGTLNFGTMDYIYTADKRVANKKSLEGYGFVKKVVRHNEEMYQLFKVRYTAEEGKELFEKLTPEGQRLVREFTAKSTGNEDLFNREYLADFFNVVGEIDGWLSRSLRTKEGIAARFSGKKANFREKTAGNRKMRNAEGGHLENFEKQLANAIIGLGEESINNRFIREQLAVISKPIPRGGEPSKGWVEVVVGKKGLMLPNDAGRESVTVISEDEFGMKSSKTFMKPVPRVQVPKALYNRYQTLHGLQEEMTTTAKIMQNIANYWAINVLFYGGSVGTNFIGGGILYGGYIIDGFYTDLVEAVSKADSRSSLLLPRTRKRIMAPLAILGKWGSIDSAMYGGMRSTYAGQFMDTEVVEGFIGKMGNVLLFPFGTVENYWKKSVALAEGGDKMPRGDLKEQMKQLQKEEKKLMSEVNQAIDEWTFDYYNVAPAIESLSKHPAGKLAKPFAKYPYKYSKKISSMVAAPFDKNRSPQERVVAALTLATIMAIVLAIDDRSDKERETPKGSEDTPSALSSKGRLLLGKSGLDELFIRTSKYPFFNVGTLGKNLIQGEFNASRQLLSEQLGGLGPLSKSALATIGFKSEYDQYTSTPAIIAKEVASFIPAFRILNDVGDFIDPVKRIPKTPIQGFFSTLPVWGSEETKQKFKGSPQTTKIPIEKDTRSITDKKNVEVESKINRGDLLLASLTGIYITRINVDNAKAQETREERNKAEDKIRALLLDGNNKEAQDIAYEYGLTIPKGTYDYYRKKRATK